MAEAVVLLDNLFFQARILDAAKRIGVAVKMVTTRSQFLAEVRANPQALLVVDLEANAQPVEAIEQLRATGNRQPVVAFLSHVEVNLAERARAAGCRQVLSRSQFTQRLPTILGEAKAAGGPEPSSEPKPAPHPDS